MSKQFPHPFGDMAKRYRKLRRELPMIASKIAENEFRQNFRRQGYRDAGGKVTPWAKRKDGSDAGRAVLVKTGRLRRETKAAPTFGHARVLNRTPYAAIHNRGGKIKGRQRVWATGLRTGKTRLRSNPEGAPAAMPARPFMITTPPLLKAIREEISNSLREVFEQSKSE